MKKKFYLFTSMIICILLYGCSSSTPSSSIETEANESIDNELVYSDDMSSCHCDVTKFPISLPYGDSEITITDIVLIEDCINYEYKSALILTGDRSLLSDSDRHWLENEDFIFHSGVRFSEDNWGGSKVGKMYYDNNNLYFWIFIETASRESISNCDLSYATIYYTENDINYDFSFNLPLDNIVAPNAEILDDNMIYLWNTLMND